MVPGRRSRGSCGRCAHSLRAIAKSQARSKRRVGEFVDAARGRDEHGPQGDRRVGFAAEQALAEAEQAAGVTVIDRAERLEVAGRGAADERCVVGTAGSTAVPGLVSVLELAVEPGLTGLILPCDE